MPTPEEPIDGVLIDGAVPRTAKERVDVLVVYAEVYYEIGDRPDLKPRVDSVVDATSGGDYTETWLEDELISVINESLPDAYECVVGEPDPGDVVVRLKETTWEHGA